MSESFGALIGLSNVLTRSRSRSPAGPDLDADPGLRERLHAEATRALEGSEAFIHDAVVHGRRVRLFTNSHHLADFWRDNWPTEAEWLGTTGLGVPRPPALTVYAMIRVPAQPEASYASERRGEVFLFNTSWYGDLRACALEALDRRLAAEGEGLLHGSAVELEGRGLVLLYPKEVIHPTPVWGLMELPSSRFVAEGWLLRDATGRVRAVEKGIYVRASVAAAYPERAAALLRGKFENVPDGAAGRLTLSDDARALVAPAALFGKERVTAGPLAPAAAFALRAGGGEAVRPASVPPFDGEGYELCVGAVPGHPREVARLIARTARR